MPENSLSLVERYGSFGMLCLIFAWVALWLSPKIMALINTQREEFLAALTAEREHRTRVMSRYLKRMTRDERAKTGAAPGDRSCEGGP